MYIKLAKKFAISPLDDRYLSKLKNVELCFSEKALMKHRVKAEAAWLVRLATEGVIDPKKHKLSENELKSKLSHFDDLSETGFQKIKSIEATTNHDVKAVEYYIKEELTALGFTPEFREFTHFLCTSEDINNIAYAQMFKDFKDKVYIPGLNRTVDTLSHLAKEWRSLPMMSLTHGQPATPTTMGKEVANFAYRINRQMQQANSIRFLAKMNGATGSFNGHYITEQNRDWMTLVRDFIEKDLGLQFNLYTTQIEPHDSICEFMNRMLHANTIGIGMCQDMWGYISRGYFKLKVQKGEIGSSIMPHKVNPIDFENAEGNFGVANGLLEHFCRKLPISRYQRDLSDSTVMRNFGVAGGHTMLALDSLHKALNKITACEETMRKDLDEHYELLAEPIQQILRMEGVEQAYELLKDFTRGQKVTAQSLQTFIGNLKVAPGVKDRLKTLSPATYVGSAEQIVDMLDQAMKKDKN